MAPTPDPFAVTTPASTVPLSVERRGELAVSVTNVTGRPIRARLHVVPVEPAKAEWFAVAGESERDFPLGATQAYAVVITVPPEVPEGTYSVRLDAAAEDEPQETFTTGPTVAVTVGPGRPKKKFPWWIVAVIAAVLVIAAIVIFLLTRDGDQEVIDVTGLPATTAIQALQNADFTPEPTTVPTTPCDPPVATQDPVGGTKASGGSTVTLTLGPCTNVVSIPDVTGQKLSVGTATLRGLGLTVEFVTLDEFADNCDPPILGQNPNPGTQVAAGTSVSVAARREPKTCRLVLDPNVRIIEFKDLFEAQLSGS